MFESSTSSTSRARIVSVVAATIISLACGTNYVYSAWAPHFGHEMKLSATDINLIGTFANLGTYSAGIPVGLLVDAKGPRPAVLLGSFLTGIGYFGIKKAYDGGAGSVTVPWLCFFSFLTGSGGGAAISGAIKTAAINWPDHRGTATAFPLSGFGLSAFFFSSLSSIAFPDNTSGFLFLLAVGTFFMMFLSSFAIYIVPHSIGYSAIPTSDERGRRSSTPLHRNRSEDSSRRFEELEAGLETPKIDIGEDSSLTSESSGSVPGDIGRTGVDKDSLAHELGNPDIKGLAMLPRAEFWQLFFLLGLLTANGLMTINNIGNNTHALWIHWDDSVDTSFVLKQQLAHVSTISVLSFIGRLLSGIGSDMIAKKLHMSRFWCLFISSFIFSATQICSARLENPNLLGLVSAMTGLAYGFLYGVFTSIVAETFGIHGLSQNLGCLTIAPIIFGNIFNILYGRIYDRHSFITPDGHRECLDGVYCYSLAYYITFAASLTAVVISLWSIRHAHNKKARARRKLIWANGRQA